MLITCPLFRALKSELAGAAWSLGVPELDAARKPTIDEHLRHRYQPEDICREHALDVFLLNGTHAIDAEDEAGVIYYNNGSRDELSKGQKRVWKSIADSHQGHRRSVAQRVQNPIARPPASCQTRQVGHQPPSQQRAPPEQPLRSFGERLSVARGE